MKLTRNTSQTFLYRFPCVKARAVEPTIGWPQGLRHRVHHVSRVWKTTLLHMHVYSCCTGTSCNIRLQCVPVRQGNHIKIRIQIQRRVQVLCRSDASGNCSCTLRRLPCQMILGAFLHDCKASLGTWHNCHVLLQSTTARNTRACPRDFFQGAMLFQLSGS